VKHTSTMVIIQNYAETINETFCKTLCKTTYNSLYNNLSVMSSLPVCQHQANKHLFHGISEWRQTGVNCVPQSLGSGNPRAKLQLLAQIISLSTQK